MSARGTAGLRREALARGVAVAYTDADGVRRRVADDTLAAVLDLVGPRLRDAAGREGNASVVVAWDGDRAALSQFTAAEPGCRPARRAIVRGEDGADLGPAGTPPTTRSGARGAPRSTALPFGVHSVDRNGEIVAHVISAPRRVGPARAFTRGAGRSAVPPGAGSEVRHGETAGAASKGGATDAGPRPWGLFVPAYAVRDRRGRAAGDLTSLGALGSLVGRLGGEALATLPMLAEHATADGAAPGQRPYSPISRMFWNEAYLDLDRIPELSAVDGETRRVLDEARPRQRARVPDPSRYADLASIASAARPALDVACHRMRSAGGARLAAYEAYVSSRPDLRRYARFRAACEEAGAEVDSWPAAWRAGRIGEGEVGVGAEHRHAFAQWATDVQLGETAAALRSSGVGLVLDLPIGCAAGGFDAWAHPDAFVTGASIGAPPDGFFRSGQDWGFPPPHPSTDRSQGYPVMRACLAHNLRHASMLRVDHVLGWSRLWWVPAGAAASSGTYVAYPLEEIVAVASLEAWRSGAQLLGEDLGTVERGLRPTLRSHGVAQMRVALFELGVPSRPLRHPAGTVSYVDTHDTATFAGWFAGSDVALREQLGLLAPDDAASELVRRSKARAATVERLLGSHLIAEDEQESVGAVLGALLEELGSSRADLVLVAVEDLLGETSAQNLPGTTTEHPNFARRLALSVEELSGDDRVLATLRRLDASRRREPRRSR
ncbi:MAG TPA: 4-alpha-glucanotransferase [Acidimicrobiales bacterium]|nr:4-alpha-glucanotransferase [Acidimicrobiales bacterium]